MTTAVPTFGVEKPTAAKLNALADVIAEAYVILGDVGTEFPAEGQWGSGQVWRMVHVYRYLHFSSSGAIVDPTGVNPDVSISEDDTGQGVLDLDTVSWLAYGQLYKLTGISWCMESSDA
jgi:hypothetical protein